MANNNKKAQAQKQDLGYKAYIAAFAVMLLIIIAAICVLSGCLDEFIFGGASDGANSQAESSDTLSPNSDKAPVSTDTSEPDDTEEAKGTEEVTTDSDTETAESSADTEKSEDPEKSEDETKKPPETDKQETSAVPPETEKLPETTAAADPATTEEPETEGSRDNSDEIFEAINDRILYSYSKSGLAITGYEDAGVTEIKIPTSLDGVSVTSIGASAFKDMEHLKKVTISYGVTSIGSEAMGGCDKLEYVYIPTSVTSIADDAFAGSEDVVINCKKGSYAEKYAEKNGIEYNAK